MSKYRVGGKSKNDNRVDLFIWHLGVLILAKLQILKSEYNPEGPLEAGLST